MRVGIVGSGRIGSSAGTLLTRAGHEVMFSSRPGSLSAERAAAQAGPPARHGTAAEAAAFGDAVLLAVLWVDLPTVAREHRAALAGKLVIDPVNPLAERAGGLALLEVPGGVTPPRYHLSLLGDVRLVRSFSMISTLLLERGVQGQAGGPRADMPCWGDDADAKKRVAGLIHDAGFTAVDRGGLDDARYDGPA